MARNPITWQNIHGPDPRHAVSSLGLASHTINNAFGNFKEALSDYKSGVVEQNTNAYLNALDQYRTPEALQAAMESGAVDRLRQQFGNYISPEARNAAGANLDALLKRQHSIEDQTFQRNADTRAGEAHSLGTRLTDLQIGSASEDLKSKRLTNNRAASVQAIQDYIKKMNVGLSVDPNTTPSRIADTHAQAYHALVGMGFDGAEVQKALDEFAPMATFDPRYATNRRFLEASQASEKAKVEDLKGLVSFAKGLNPTDNHDNLDNLTKALTEALSEGYDLGDGVKVPIPTSYLYEAIAAAPRDNWSDSAWSQEFKAYLDNRLAREDAIADMRLGLLHKKANLNK